jgi:hydrogenase maturation protease
MRTKVILLGLGNILLSDEGLGVHAVRALERQYYFPEEVRLVDGGTLGLDLLPWIEGVEKAPFIDALNLQQEPRTVAVMEDEAVPSYLSPKLSFHHLGLPDLLFASKLTGTMPVKVALIGMQPERIEVGLTLSPTVAGNFGKLLKGVLEKLREWGVDFREKPWQEAAHVSGRPF